jgi:hypothetical protein
LEARVIEIINPVLVGGGIAAAMFVGILVFLAIGRRIGQRHLASHGLPSPAAIGSLETAVFALLGLMIAFTFSGALSRFDTRRAQAVDEANAIGTAYLRIDVLPAAAQPRLRETLRSYVDSRIATYQKLPDVGAARRELARSQALQGEIWVQAVAATALPDSRAGSDLVVLPALNAMFDITTVRMVATQIHPPTIIYAMLIGLALASALLAGYQGASERALNWVHQVGFAGIVAVTVYVIFEIEYPRLGFVRIDAIDQVLLDARAAMN